MFENGDIRRHHEHNRAKTLYNSKLFAFCASCSSGNDRNCRNYIPVPALAMVAMAAG